MTLRQKCTVLGLLVAVAISAGHIAQAQNNQAPPGQTPGDGEQVARIAEIEIDPAQLLPYKAALQQGITAALEREPGVLALFAVTVKGHPEQVRVFELYSSQAAYQAHLQTPHFKRYKAATQGMVRSLRIIETDPILLRSRNLP